MLASTRLIAPRRFLSPTSTFSALRLFSTSSHLAYAHPQATYQTNHGKQSPDNMALLDVYASLSLLDPTLRSEVTLDHNNVKDLYTRYKSASSNEEKSTLVKLVRSTSSASLDAIFLTFAFCPFPALAKVIRELATHSEAEEVSVYNVLEQKGLIKEGKELRDEHEQLEKVLYSVDWTKVDSSEFAPKFEHAIQLFIQHSDREEEEVLKQLEGKLSPEENDKLARDFLAKRHVVPTRPHPVAPQSGGLVQKVLGMATKPHDKILETLQGRSFADLKYQHESGKVQPIKIDSAVLAA
ncbi:hypothetical protein JCM11641_003964 [Rhodosporidiobolus odoratus]